MAAKHWKYSQRLLALHEDWAVKNGYRDKPQAASSKRQAPNNHHHRSTAPSGKRATHS
tara:strand:- start:403 stop:576 length:174 start_codon:yes stop_codon:yes gene_type:complete